MNKISAIIPTYNEEGNIKEAIQSCSFADEIIVVDSFSTDNTVEIARSFPEVKVLEHEYINSAAQKNWTIPQVAHNWVFVLDADERTTPALIEEIKNTVALVNNTSAYWIPRANYFMGKHLRYVWKGDAVVRLFKKDDCKYQEKHVHAEIETKGEISHLKNHLIHDTYEHKGLESHVIKNYRYSTWAAYDRVDKIKKVTFFHLAVKPAFAFFKRYIMRGGILDGKQGFIVSAFGAWSVFLRNVKIWRMHNGEKIDSK